jgi:hypothetical protein
MLHKMVWEAFKTGFGMGLGVLAAAATGLILWGAFDWLQELTRIARNLKGDEQPRGRGNEENKK